MFRKWFVTIAASLMLVGISASPISPVGPNLVKAEVWPCSDPAQNSSWVGWKDTTNVHGARSWIDPADDTDHDFAYCDGGAPNVDGALAWVAVTPHTGANSTTILQVGFCRTRNFIQTFCNGAPSGKVGYFVAAGGCGWGIESHRVGNWADPLQHKFTLDKGTGSSANWWYAYVDGTLMWQWNSATDIHLSCWLPGASVDTQIQGERWDHGDSYGSIAPGQKTSLNEIGYKRQDNDTWQHWVLSQGQACNLAINDLGDTLCTTHNDFNGGWNNIDLLD